jgi:hypothetical protein
LLAGFAILTHFVFRRKTNTVPFAGLCDRLIATKGTTTIGLLDFGKGLP